MSTTLWRIDYSNGDLEHISARTAVEAIANSQDPAAEMESVVRLTVGEALTDAYSDDWHNDPDLAQVICRPGQLSGLVGRVILIPTAVVREDGEIDPDALANFRALRRRWAEQDSARFDNGRVDLCESGPAPGDLIAVLRTLRDDGVLNPVGAEDDHAEMAPDQSARTTRVAVRTAEDDRWQVHEVPVSVLGSYDAEASAIPGSFRSPVIVVDAVPGFAAGCSTWSEVDPEELDQARAEHWNCEHTVFTPAV